MESAPVVNTGAEKLSENVEKGKLSQPAPFPARQRPGRQYAGGKPC